MLIKNGFNEDQQLQQKRERFYEMAKLNGLYI